MDLYVLNSSYEKIAVIDNYQSIIWTLRYFTPGDFELYTPATPELLQILQVDNMLVRDRDCINDEYHNVMMIRNIEIQSDAETGDSLIITGQCLKSIVARRVVANQTNLSGTVTDCIRQLITENIISPNDSDRAIDNFTLGTDSVDNPPVMKMQITGDNLATAIAELGATYGYGWDVYIKAGNLVFYIYEGADRSFNQNINPHVVFSTEYDNLLSSNYKENRDNYANVAIVAGEGEGTARKKVTVGTATGLDRIELWVDDRNASSNDGEITSTEYLNLLEAAGEEKLAETEITTEFTGEILPGANFTYGVDYFLGDIVQIENDYGISKATRITEIIASKDENGENVIPTFEEGGI